MQMHGLALDSGEFIPAEELNQERPIMTTTPHGQVPAIQRYKIGYHADEWGVRSLSPTGIYDDAGPWVRYEDHAAELRRLHARIAELEAQLSSSGFTAADMATAAAQGFRDGVDSLSASAGEPAAYLIDWPDEPELGHYFSESPTETGRCRPLYLAAPPTAQAEGWRPIETAPKDGTRILVHPAIEVADAWSKAHWSAQNECWIVGGSPSGVLHTAWHPLPPPPTSAEGVEHV